MMESDRYAEEALALLLEREAQGLDPVEPSRREVEEEMLSLVGKELEEK